MARKSNLKPVVVDGDRAVKKRQLFRVFVSGTSGEIYDERFIWAGSEHEAYTHGVGKGLTKYAYDEYELGWSVEAFTESHWFEVDNFDVLMAAASTVEDLTPFVVKGIDMETEPVPSDQELRGE